MQAVTGTEGDIPAFRLVGDKYKNIPFKYDPSCNLFFLYRINFSPRRGRCEVLKPETKKM